jgi:predicted AAA+ superfamily ATPase
MPNAKKTPVSQGTRAVESKKAAASKKSVAAAKKLSAAPKAKSKKALAKKALAKIRPIAASSLGIQDLANALERIAAAIERLAPVQAETLSLAAADAFVWHAATQTLQPVPHVSRVEIGLLRGIDRVRDILTDNTERFSRGLPANNALLWGARGMGKSSLVKAAHAGINANLSFREPHLKLIEIHREDIDSLPRLMTLLRDEAFQFLLFCDDLSFDVADTSYKSLKAVLEGGIEGRPRNVLFYATSNRRHLMPRDMVDNERGTAINPGEAVEEKISLSDRFGLWLGFHNCSQADYLDMIFAYVTHFGLIGDNEKITAEALEWSVTRGARSGRTAWQFIQDLAGRMGIVIG